MANTLQPLNLQTCRYYKIYQNTKAPICRTSVKNEIPKRVRYYLSQMEEGRGQVNSDAINIKMRNWRVIVMVRDLYKLYTIFYLYCSLFAENQQKINLQIQLLECIICNAGFHVQLIL